MNRQWSRLKRFFENTPPHVRHISLSFDQVALIVGSDSLPPSAYRFREYWGNDPTHSHARAWLRAGWTLYRADVEKRLVEFEKSGTNEDSRQIDLAFAAMASDEDFQSLNLQIEREFAVSDYEALTVGENETR